MQSQAAAVLAMLVHGGARARVAAFRAAHVSSDSKDEEDEDPSRVSEAESKDGDTDSTEQPLALSSSSLSPPLQLCDNALAAAMAALWHSTTVVTGTHLVADRFVVPLTDGLLALLQVRQREEHLYTCTHNHAHTAIPTAAPPPLLPVIRVHGGSFCGSLRCKCTSGRWLCRTHPSAIFSTATVPVTTLRWVKWSNRACSCHDWRRGSQSRRCPAAHDRNEYVLNREHAHTLRAPSCG